MKKIEYERFKEHILDYFPDTKELKNEIERYKTIPDSHGTLWGAVDTMCQYGLFDVYYGQCLDTLKEVYGDEFDESRYFTKKGDWRWQKNTCYLWTVYKAKICKTIEMMIKKGELK